MKSQYKLKSFFLRDLVYYYDENTVKELKGLDETVIKTHRWEKYKELYDTTIHNGRIRFLQKPERSSIRFENGVYKIYPAAVYADLVRREELLK